MLAEAYANARMHLRNFDLQADNSDAWSVSSGEVGGASDVKGRQLRLARKGAGSWRLEVPAVQEAAVGAETTSRLRCAIA